MSNGNATDFYDKINFDGELAEDFIGTKIDDSHVHFHGFIFDTVAIENAMDQDGIEGMEFFIAELPELSATWAITAISLSDSYGLGMSASPLVVDSYKKFYLDYSLPTGIKVGEIFLLEILVGNLHTEKLAVTVQVSGEGLSISRPWIYGWKELDSGVTQKISIPAFNIHRLLVEVKAETFGTFEFLVTASCSKGIEKKAVEINVVQQGFLKRISDTRMILKKDCESASTVTIQCQFDEDSTPTVFADVFGDTMGLTLSNLWTIFKEPKGSAEDVLYKLAASVISLDYLLSINQLTVKDEEELLYFLNHSFQQLLTYSNPDGSFSEFQNTEASTWLTANAFKFLNRAKKFIKIDQKILDNSLSFIASSQLPSGKFIPCSTSNSSLSYVGFTALIGMLIKENCKSPRYHSVIQKAIEHVNLQLDKNNLYSLALVTHFMFEVDSPVKYKLLQSLLRHIQHIDLLPKGPNVTSVDIEINSHCLITLANIPELYDEAFTILQWLIEQQRPNGKFFTARDTIVALEAISRFSSKISNQKVNLDVQLVSSGDDGYVESFEINGSTRLTKQRFSVSCASYTAIKNFT